MLLILTPLALLAPFTNNCTPLPILKKSPRIIYIELQDQFNPFQGGVVVWGWVEERRRRRERAVF
jgi:hypothetical protein